MFGENRTGNKGLDEFFKVRVKWELFSGDKSEKVSEILKAMALGCFSSFTTLPSNL